MMRSQNGSLAGAVCRSNAAGIAGLSHLLLLEEHEACTSQKLIAQLVGPVVLLGAIPHTWRNIPDGRSMCVNQQCSPDLVHHSSICPT